MIGPTELQHCFHNNIAYGTNIIKLKNIYVAVIFSCLGYILSQYYNYFTNF